MGSKDTSAPTYPTTTTSSGGLFGSSTTNQLGSTYNPTDFERQQVDFSKNNALNFLNEYVNPNYDSDAFKQSDAYYTNKMNNVLQNNYLNGALANGLMRGSTASDTMRGFATDLANTEYERQQDYKNQQLQNYQASMLPYATVYDMYTGTTQLNNNLSNALANYNLDAWKTQQQLKQAQQNSLASILGSSIGALGSIASAPITGGTSLVGLGTNALSSLGKATGNRYIV